MRLDKFSLTVKEKKQPTKKTLVNSRKCSHNVAFCRKVERFLFFTTSSKRLPEVKKKKKKPKTLISSAGSLVNAVSVTVASRHSKGRVAVVGGVGGQILTQRHGLFQLGSHC